MKKAFEKYLKDIKLSKTMMDTINEKYNLLKAVSGIEEFEDMFLSEGKSDKGSREYFSLWLFTNNVFFKLPISSEDIDMLRLRNYITLVSIEDRNFDLETPNEDSRFSCSIRRIDAEIMIAFSATGTINCLKLLDINRKYFLPNLQQ